MGVTMRDVAKAAGTSVASVSAALHGTRGETIRVGEATRQKIRKIAEQLGYETNPIAKSLATGRTRVLGLMLPYADAFLDENPFCSQVMHGVMAEAVKRHYNVMMYTAVERLAEFQSPLAIDSRVDGVVVVMPPADAPLLTRCERRGIPFVAVLLEPSQSRWCVNADDYTGGRLATEHLVRLGHRHIAHLAGTPNVSTTAPRRLGYTHVMEESGYEATESMIVTSGFSTTTGYESMCELLDRPGSSRITAVFAANDLCAEGAMRAARERGLSIPDDLAFVGYDDTWFAAVTQPPLTSVRMPISEMGAKAAAMLIDQLEGREVPDIQPVLPVSLTIRQSSGDPSAPSHHGTERVPALVQ